MLKNILKLSLLLITIISCNSSIEVKQHTTPEVIYEVEITKPLNKTNITEVTDSATFVVEGNCSNNGAIIKIRQNGNEAANQDGFICDGTKFKGTIDTTALVFDEAYILTAEVVSESGSVIASVAINTYKISHTVSIVTANPIISLNESAYTFSGTCNVNDDNVDITIDGTILSSTKCLLGVFTTPEIDLSGVADGLSITMDVVHGTDSDTTNVVKDTSLPSISMNVPVDVNLVNRLTYSLNGTCNENGRDVNVSFGSLTNTVSCTLGTWSITNWDISAESDSLTLNITSIITDATGNPAQASNTIVKDTIIPTVTITSPSIANLSNYTAYSLAGTCSDNGETINVDLGALSNTAICTSLAWSITNWDINTEADSVAIAITADIDDALGNSAVQATNTLIKDIVVPTVTINPAVTINLANYTTYGLSGACSENGEDVTVKMGILTTVVTCTGLGWTITNLNTSTVSDSLSLNITVDFDSSNGNPAVQGSRTVVKDTIVPTVTLAAPSRITPKERRHYALNGACSDNGQTVQVTVGLLTNSATCTTLAWSITEWDVTNEDDSAAVAITVNVDDSAGNSAIEQTGSVVKQVIGKWLGYGGGARRITVRDDFAYIANEARGFTIYDISDDNAIFQVSSYQGIYEAKSIKISADGNTAFIGAAIEGLVILDITDLANPTLISTYATTGGLMDLDLSADENTIYLAEYNEGASIINVTDLANPVRLGGYKGAGDIFHGVKVSKNSDHLYVVDYNKGFIVLDITDINSITKVHEEDPVGFGEHINLSVDKDTLYFSSSTGGVSTFDVTTPSSPTNLNVFNTSGRAYQTIITSDLNTMFVADFNKGIQVLNVTNPASFVWQNDKSNGVSTGLDLSSDNSKLYALDSVGGITVYDVSTPALINKIGEHHATGAPYRETFSSDGKIQVIADKHYGIVIIDHTNIEAPKLASFYDTSGQVYSVAISPDNNTIYLADYNTGLIIMDITDITTPTLLGTFPISGLWTTGYGIDITVTSDKALAFIANESGGVVSLDISDPSAISALHYRVEASKTEAVKVASDNKTVFSIGPSFVIYDWTNPAAPVKLGEDTTPTAGEGVILSADENTAYVFAGTQGLYIFDVTDRSAPSLTGSYDTAGTAYDGVLSSDGNTLYIADSDTVVELDITNPATPLFVRDYFKNIALRIYKDINISTDGSRLYVPGAHSGTFTFLTL